MYSSLTSWFICPHSFASISFPSSCPLCVAVYICVPLVSAIGIVVFTIFELLSPVNIESSRKPGAPHSSRVERQAERYIYGDAEGTVPTLEIYAEVYLAETYRIDHYEELEHAPLILEAELYLYFTPEGGLAERYPPRLIDWQQRLQAILDSIRELAPILEEEFA